jgi:hypothetical protein
MSDVICVVECPDGFNDFSIVKDIVPIGGRVEVNESQFTQMKRSQPSVVCVEKKMELDPEAAARIAEEQAKKGQVKEEIRARHEKDAPPRRVRTGTKIMTDTRKGVSPGELVDLPVTQVPVKNE